MGKQAVDGDSNQVGQILAELPRLADGDVRRDHQEEDGALLVGREVDGGVLTLRVKLPAVVTVDLRIVAPTSVYSKHTAPTLKYNDGVRFAALPAIMAAKKKPLVEMKLADLVADTALKVKYTRLRAAAARKAGIKVKDVAELVEKLKSTKRRFSDCQSTEEPNHGQRSRRRRDSAKASSRRRRTPPSPSRERSPGARRHVLDPRPRRRREGRRRRARRLRRRQGPRRRRRVASRTTSPSATRRPSPRRRSKGFDVVVATASAYGKDLAAARRRALGAGYAADISRRQRRGRQAHRTSARCSPATPTATAEITTPIQVVTVRQSEFAAAEPTRRRVARRGRRRRARRTRRAERVEFVVARAR